jgi:UDP-N-acetylglucosamine 2-epimerase (non-hydrolysing)
MGLSDILRYNPPAASPLGLRDVVSGVRCLFRGKRETERFKAELKAFHRVDHCFLVSSGKAALMIILQALQEMHPDRDEVLIPAFTCYSVPSAIVRAGLKVRLCDIDPETLDYDFEKLSEISTADRGPRTAAGSTAGNQFESQATHRKLLAVLSIHLFGLGADVQRLRGLLEDPKVAIVEDAAQAMGNDLNGDKIGTLSDVGFFSLGRGKSLSAVEGGIILTNRNDLAEMIQKRLSKVPRYGPTAVAALLVQSVLLSIFTRPSLFCLPKSLPFLRLGETIFDPDFPICRMSAFQAGLARNWQSKLARFQQVHSENSRYFLDALESNCPSQWAVLPRRRAPERESLLRFPLRINDEPARSRVLKQGRRLGIMPTYPDSIDGIPELRAFLDGRSFPAARQTSRELLTLPVHPYVSENDKSRIVNLIQSLVYGRLTTDKAMDISVKDILPSPRAMDAFVRSASPDRTKKKISQRAPRLCGEQNLPATNDLQPKADHGPSTMEQNPQSATRNPQLATRNSQPVMPFSLHLIAAARPNFMKIAPLYHALSKESWAQAIIVHTGQHYDLNMSDTFFQDLALPHPHVYLGVGSGSHAQQTGRVMEAYEKVLLEHNPDLVVVVGDVNSTMAAALAAVKLGIRVAHLEAGLRSFDRTMPEEINRVVTDAVADYLWTPSADADENLLWEGIAPQKIERVGNIMIDSMELLRDKIQDESAYPAFGLRPGEYGLVTLHRPVNVDDPEILSEYCKALGNLAARMPVLFPVHPRTRRNLEKFALWQKLEEGPGLQLIKPLSYIPFMNLLFNCRFAVTDSGGIQEETTYLGIPCLTMRPNTERPITITEGTNRLCKVDDLDREVEAVLSNSDRKPCTIELWDGRTAARIVDHIKNDLLKI